MPKHEDMEMTFDTSFHEPPRSKDDDLHSRPELRTASTMPALGTSALGAMAMEPNAWADHDEGHRDGEISMTFE